MTMTHRPRIQTLLFSVATTTAVAVAMVLFADSADAVSTRVFRLDSAEELNGGELDGAMVRSDGSVVAGVARDRVDFEGVPLARCVVEGPGGAYFVGTGDEGKIYKVAGDAVTVFAETGQLMVASCVAGGGTLYAGTLPEGRVFAINMQSGESRELVRLEDAEHVWSLALQGDRLFAGTGPEGKLYAINVRTGAAELRLDSDQGHILSLALDGNALYAGTDGSALLYRLEGNEVRVIQDFPGNEVTALAARNGVVVAAANDMPAPRAATTSTTKVPTKTATPRAGKGRLFRIDSDGRVERVFADESEHFTTVELDEAGIAYVGSGKEGRVYRVGPGRTSATWLDVDERQVLAIHLGGSSPVVVTGDSAALYRTRPAETDAAWISKVLDADYRSRFGRVQWRGSGRIDVSTRSGNTEEPDEHWSEWSAPVSTAGPVRSTAARYLQVRAVLRGDAELRAIEVFYLPQNQRAALGPVGLKAPSKKLGPDALPNPSTNVELSWSVDNPDDDALRYRLRYREDGQTLWRDMFREDVVLTDSHYTWNTNALPDGVYIVEVSATDVLANPVELALADRRASEAIRIDNHAPTFDALSVRGRTLRGSVEDSLGPIRRLEWALDGGEFQTVFPEDGLLDERQEVFVIDLANVEAGSHIFAIRAHDGGGNSAVAELTATLR